MNATPTATVPNKYLNDLTNGCPVRAVPTPWPRGE